MSGWQSNRTAVAGRAFESIDGTSDEEDPQMNLVQIEQRLAALLRGLRGSDLEPARVTRTGANIQTDLDQRTDELLARSLCEILDVPIMSEESPYKSLGGAGHCWIVDPIDGTLNAVAGTDDFAVCVCLVRTDDLQPLVAGVYLPRSDQLYRAVLRHGAFLEDRRLLLPGGERERWRSDQKIAAFGVPKDGPAVADRMSGSLRRLYAGGWVTRQTGAASIDICRVASGTWSAFFEYGLMFWDFAAAALIAGEAGCTVRAVPRRAGLAGQPVLEYDFIVAGSPRIHAEVSAATGILPIESGQG